jgi:hypothetical protein|tara:strand:+ start:407 stop:625 length:219 start_codon:yes stop_codon:yes gene_type:complete
MDNINRPYRRVWKAIGYNYILFGTVIEKRKTNGWSMVKVRWEPQPSGVPMADEWQRVVNLGYVDDLVSEINK